MIWKSQCLLLLLVLSGIFRLEAQKEPSARSEWAQLRNGHLEYKQTPRGDRIMDFSYAGYGGGGVAIPLVQAAARVYPVDGDNTETIQRVIDSVGKLPLQNGFRGAVVLMPGTFSCTQSLIIKNSGVVLRGSGAGSKIVMTGQPHVGIRIEAPVQTRPAGERIKVTATYVPSGTNVVTVADSRSLKTGDVVVITKPVTEEWVRFMGMGTLVRNGKKQTWITGELAIERMITAIKGNTITVDVPLTDGYDAAFIKPGATVQKVIKSGGLQNAGIEDLQIEAPEQSVTISQGHHSAIRTRGLTDGWIRKVQIRNTVNSIGISGRRITVDAVQILHTVPTVGAAKPADLAADGAQLFFNRCTIRGDNVFFLATGAKVSGPIVLLNCTFNGNGWIQPHQRWATGLLIDGCAVPNGGIDFMNRGEMGSGHGWAIGWAVAWNCRAQSYLNQQPPGAFNWMIGCIGERRKNAMPFNKEPLLAEGVYDSYNKPVAPKSLYLEQLKERLGKAALSYIGYAGE